jgi:hypothetical protein
MTNIEVPGLFEPAWCAAQVARLTAEGFGEAAPAYPPRYRNNTRWVADAPSLAAELYARAAPHLPATWVDDDGRRWRCVGLNPRVRACRYGVGEAFGVHRDGVYWASDDERSFLSVVLYLDEGFSGGHTRVFADRSAREVIGRVVPRTGTLAVFPHTLWHDGAPVLAGTKHVLRTDVMYRAEGPGASAGHRGYVWALAARGQQLLSAGRDRRLCVWRQGRLVGAAHDAHEASITCLAVGRTGSLASGSRDQTVACWELDGDTLVPRWRARPHAGAVLSVVWSGDGVVSAGADGRAVWLRDGAVVAAAQLHSGWAWQLAACAGGVLSVGEDGRLVHGTPRGVQASHALGVGPLRALLVLDEARVVVGGLDGRLHVVRVADGAVRATWAGHAGAVTCLGLRADGALLSGGEDDRAVCWGADGELSRAREVRVHQDFVRAVCADGAGWASAGYDGLTSGWRGVDAADVSPARAWAAA